MANDKEELEKWLEAVPDKVTRNTTIVTPKDLKQSYLFHISKNTTIKTFIPSVSARGADSENRQITRIHTSDSLMGCMIGYGAIESDFHTISEGYKGGYKIYALPFGAALKPNARLVYDAKHSEEYWLVTYNKDTVEYKPVNAGKLFIGTLTYNSRNSAIPHCHAIIYVDVLLEEGIKFDNKNYLPKGQWKLEGDAPSFSSLMQKGSYKVEKMLKEDYLKVKENNAALLSESPIPAFAKW
jgi:hypothetical protein